MTALEWVGVVSLALAALAVLAGVLGQLVLWLEWKAGEGDVPAPDPARNPLDPTPLPTFDGRVRGSLALVHGEPTEAVWLEFAAAALSNMAGTAGDLLSESIEELPTEVRARVGISLHRVRMEALAASCHLEAQRRVYLRASIPQHEEVEDVALTE